MGLPVHVQTSRGLPGKLMQVHHLPPAASVCAAEAPVTQTQGRQWIPTRRPADGHSIAGQHGGQGSCPHWKEGSRARLRGQLTARVASVKEARAHCWSTRTNTVDQQLESKLTSGGVGGGIRWQNRTNSERGSAGAGGLREGPDTGQVIQLSHARAWPPSPRTSATPALSGGLLPRPAKAGVVPL